MKYKLGKLPARRGAVKFKFSQYFSQPYLPKPPLCIGHENIGHAWGMLANDRLGNCVFAGAAHEHMVWTHMGSRAAGADFTDANVISDYAAVSGYDGSTKSDVGCDMSQAAGYRRKVGIIDASGARHKIDAYVALEPGNYEQLALALYLTGAVGIGIRAPDNVETLFERDQPWDIGVWRTPKIIGGHYIPAVARNNRGLFVVVTWGKYQAMTNRWYEKYCDEAIAYISWEIMESRGFSPDGFDRAGLLKNVAALENQ